VTLVEEVLARLDHFVFPEIVVGGVDDVLADDGRMNRG
jgi:hypothetical protein